IVVAVIAVVGLAGCMGPSSSGIDSGNSTEKVGVVLSISQEDRQELQSLQQDLRVELQQGNISQMEAQRQLQQRRQDALNETRQKFESEVRSRQGVEIVESSDRAPIYLIRGPSSSVIGLLETEYVSGIISESQYQNVTQPAPAPGAGAGAGTGTGAGG
ncbi:MAG: hypothetical protein SXQ77_06725, partial [Halobacteria archaeon]|nr:hypothetical protein [Halobacteria archaeon]